MRTLLERPFVLGLVLLAGLAAGVWWYLADSATPPPEPPADQIPAHDPPPPDPRLTFPTPFRNVHPDVQYVGDAACARCHAAIDKSYHAHPMGRSAELTPRATPIERYDAAANNPFRSGPFTVQVERTAGGVVHRVSAKSPAGEPLPDYAVNADLAIGSGTRGRSYLSVQDGAVWQSPASWFASGHRWDVSPGFDMGNGGRRAITSGCLFCHVNRVEPVPGSVNRYREPLPRQLSVGCERCHGPGEAHVSERSSGRTAERPDTSIVNPRHLAPALQAAICEQCHLQGEERVNRRGRDAWEFRPGLPFEQFVTVFVRHPDLAEAGHSVGQFEQVEQSRCFTRSGSMTCTTCHDPHGSPPESARDGFYRDRCLKCHESKGCSAPPGDREARSDSCTACHMPRGDSSNIAHASVTDHRIAHRPGVDAPAARGLPPGDVPLVAYRTGKHAPPTEERERDLGVVLARLAFKVPPSAGGVRRATADLAADRLTRSLATWRGDAEAWTALSVAHGVREDPARYDAAATAARLAPESEEAATELAEAALAVGKFGQAAESAGVAIRVSPTTVEPYLVRAIAYGRLGNWETAEADCRAALRIHPLHAQVRVMLGICRHHRGDAAGGRAEADTAAGLATSPQQRAMLLDWYRRETR